MTLINNILQDLQKNDTILAYIVSCLLFYHYSKDINKSLLFSIKFVLIFLFFLNFLNI